jgi:hypothetical protein
VQLVHDIKSRSVAPVCDVLTLQKVIHDCVYCAILFILGLRSDDFSNSDSMAFGCLVDNEFERKWMGMIIT